MIVYAGNILRKNVVNEDYTNDILNDKEDNIKSHPNKDRKIRLMQIFGHNSTLQQYLNDETKTDELVCEVVKNIKSLRNQNFHYVKHNSKKQQNINTAHCDRIEQIMQEDQTNISKVILKKYLSNNAFDYYKIDKVKSFIAKCYRGEHKQQAHIPNFRRIISRKELEEIIYNNEIVVKDIDENKLSCLYFMMSEMYQKSFIYDLSYDNFFKYYNVINKKGKQLNSFRSYIKKLKLSVNNEKIFLDVYKSFLSDENSSRNNKYQITFGEFIKYNSDFRSEDIIYKVMDDFVITLKSIPKHQKSFSGACQYLMMEYALQNSNIDNSMKEKSSFGHYKALLYNGLRDLFVQYIKENYTWLFDMQTNNLNAEDHENHKAFIENNYKSIQIKSYSAIDIEWYVLCKLLSPKQLNLLSGSITKYIQCINDIKNRMRLTSCNIIRNWTKYEYLNQYDNILKTIEFCIIGKISVLDIKNNTDDFDIQLNKSYLHDLFGYLNIDIDIDIT